MADYQKMYAVLCGAVSEAIDQLGSIPLALPVHKSLQAALDKAEEIYMDAPYPQLNKADDEIVEFKIDRESEKTLI
jgi:hypothetical protein